MTICVYYDARQVAKNNPSPSPSAGKPALVIEEWKKRGYDISLAAVNPVKIEDFYLAHDPAHVNAILNCEKDNGFDNRSKEVADSLKWTTGSFYSATLGAWKQKKNTCSPTSGFHHAEYDKADGFCTFNGLMVSAILLHQKEPTIKIGILDLDHHYGNGTDHIIRHQRIDYIHHYTFGGDNTRNWFWKGGAEALSWLNRLPRIVDQFKDCQIVFYQAGADPHVDDRYGGALTTEQLRLRDLIVFTKLKEMKIPVVWNLAGGYLNPIQRVLDIHNATMEECLNAMKSD